MARALLFLDCMNSLTFCEHRLTREGVKNHEKKTLLESLLLKMVMKIVRMFIHVDKMVFHKSKLKKEVLALRPLF